MSSKFGISSTVLAAAFALALAVTPAAASRGQNEGGDAGRRLTAHLSGVNEVGGGDPDGLGHAMITLNQGQSRVCFTIEVTDISPTITGAHIHASPAGANGAVVVNFNAAVNGLTGCVTADPALIKAIRQHPSDYYVNVHTNEYPGGAVRGQLSK